MNPRLQQAIDHATQALLREKPPAQAGGIAEDGLVFVGNWHGTYPSTLILDPSLGAVDVRIFLFICQYAKDFNQGATPFPSYELICKRLRISRPTLANAMTRLRLTRWVSLVTHRVRDKQGRFKGQILALSDEPMNLVDALEMDPGYMQLVEQTALNHADKRTRLVAQGVLVGIDEQIARGEDPLERRNPMLERQDSILGLDQPDALFFGIADVSGRQRQQRISTRIAQQQNSLHGVSGQSHLSTENHPGQDSLPGFLPGQNSLLGQNPPSQNSLLGDQPGKDSLLGKQVIDFQGNQNSLHGAPYSTSTGNCINTSTVTSEDQNPKPEPLNWHPQWIVISDNHKAVLQRMLNAQSPENAQKILDALAYRYQSVKERGAEPLRNGPVPYARSLFKRLAAGQLVVVKPEHPQTTAPTAPADKTKTGLHASHVPFQPEPPRAGVLSPEEAAQRIERLKAQLERVV